jgi:argininosuccinate synthase
MHVSYEGGILEDPWTAPPEDIFLMTRSPEKAPDQADSVVIEFKQGEPVSLNGKKLAPVAMLQQLNELGGRYGIGRVDIVENRFVGIKSRGVYETPGVTILHQAHRALESITLDREVMKLRDSLGTKIAELIYNGFWFSPEFQTLKNMIDDTQKPVNGEVRLKLYKGTVTTEGRRSPNSLYSEALATFEEDNVYDQADAEGFIKINSLRLRLQNISQ